ncbi:hypothetical protein J6590_021261 [Homalodisca vitripennis]|nr:hypothetical protein J6590_021261 [Homalodisca vitripennis]
MPPPPSLPTTLYAIRVESLVAREVHSVSSIEPSGHQGTPSRNYSYLPIRVTGKMGCKHPVLKTEVRPEEPKKKRLSKGELRKEKTEETLGEPMIPGMKARKGGKRRPSSGKTTQRSRSLKMELGCCRSPRARENSFRTSPKTTDPSYAGGKKPRSQLTPKEQAKGADKRRKSHDGGVTNPKHMPKRSCRSWLLFFLNTRKEEWSTGEPVYMKKGLTQYTDGSKTPKGTGAEVVALGECVRINVETGYKGKTIYINSDRKAALKCDEADETAEHITFECPALQSKRSRYLGFLRHTEEGLKQASMNQFAFDSFRLIYMYIFRFAIVYTLGTDVYPVQCILCSSPTSGGLPIPKSTELRKSPSGDFWVLDISDVRSESCECGRHESVSFTSQLVPFSNQIDTARYPTELDSLSFSSILHSVIQLSPEIMGKNNIILSLRPI